MKKTIQYSDGGDSTRSSARDGSDGRRGGANQAESTLPLQYFSRAASQSQEDGELRLMLAVLKDGIDCFLNGHLHDDGGFLEAQQWIMAGNQAGPFAYDNICETLGIEPQSLRERLKSLRVCDSKPECAPTGRCIFLGVWIRPAIHHLPLNHAHDPVRCTVS